MNEQQAVPAEQLFKRCFDITQELSDSQRMQIIFYALGEKPINAEKVREHLMCHLPARTNTAEVCTTLRAIREKAE